MPRRCLQLLFLIGVLVASVTTAEIPLAAATARSATSPVRSCGVAELDASARVAPASGFAAAACADGWALAVGDRSAGGAPRLFHRRDGRWLEIKAGTGPSAAGAYLESAALESGIEPRLLSELAQPFAVTVRQAAGAGGLLEALSAHEANLGAAGLYAASSILTADGRAWFVTAGSDGAWDVTPTATGHPYPDGTMTVYAWSPGGWSEEGVVSGWLGPVGGCCGISLQSLTGSHEPDFAIAGGGAADTNWLAVISHAGGRWHALPFRAGYSYSDVVNGVPSDGGVATAINVCACASGFTTTLFEKYADGSFQPALPPGRSPPCRLATLVAVAEARRRSPLTFTHFACADGWALASGRGSSGPLVGLFNARGATWSVVELDNGDGLGDAPATADIPLSLLQRLATGFGPAIAPELATAPLVAVPVFSSAFVPQSHVIESDDGTWFIVERPTRINSLQTVTAANATIYHWSGSAWSRRGFLSSVPRSIDYWVSGTSFRAVRVAGSPDPGFTLATISSTAVEPPAGGREFVLSDAGGAWQVGAG